MQLVLIGSKTKTVVLISVPALFILKCELNSNNIPMSNINEAITLQLGKSTILEPYNLEVGFHEVISDSRCPSNADCIWEGMAEILIYLIEPPRAANFITLKISGYVSKEDVSRHVSIDTLGYNLTLQQLDPYPVYPEERDYSEYIATILILKTEED